MAEKIDAWMPLHIGRYTAATGHLSTAEHGMYLLLLMHAWTSGGTIPAEDERIRRICRAEPKEWGKARATIMAFLTQQPDGTYRQKRLDAELTKASEVKESKSEGGKKGAAHRWQKHRTPNGIPNGIPSGTVTEIPMAKRCPIPPPPQPSASVPEPTATTGGGEVGEAHHGLAAVCAMNRVSGATFNTPYVAQWVREGVTAELLRTAIAEARRTGKPDPEIIPVRYLLPILERVRSGGGKPVDNGWRRDEKRAIAKGQELGIQPRVGEEMPHFIERVDEALRNRARSQVA